MEIVCPYCLQTIKPSDIVRSCNICSHRFRPGFKDNLLLKTGRIPKCKEPGCLGQYATLTCGKCGGELPTTIMQYDKYMRFSVVAPSSAGKSNFITAMMSELRGSSKLNFLIAAMNRQTQDYHRSCVDYMYNKLEPVPANDAGTVIPMQWSIQDMNRETKSTVPAYSMTIFDGAGEDQERVDPLICRYIAGSKMIMLLLDPTRLAGVRAQMTPDEIARAGGVAGRVSSEDTQDFINGIIRYLRTACSIRAGKKIDIPVAVVFGKIDAVARNLGSATVLESSSHARTGKFIQSEADIIHSEIEGWMDLCGDDLNKLFNANFTKWRYFGVSSFGMLPESRTKLQKPAPLRVLDPLIWNLAMEGVVPTVR